MARPPPTRPHTTLHTPSYVSSFSSPDWAEDDAWDSASDSETAAPRPNVSHSRHRTSSGSGSVAQIISPTTAPKPVPRPALNSSSSTLASSYTHLQAPSPSSYPPRVDSLPIKNGWTMVRQSKDREMNAGDQVADPRAAEGDLEGEMVVGEPDVDPKAADVNHHRARQDQGSIRDDIDEIVNDPLVLVTAPRRVASPTSSPAPEDSPEKMERLLREESIRSNRRRKFVDCLSKPDVEISSNWAYSSATLRKLAWAGIPNDLRPIAWPLLLGYMPLPTPLRSSTLSRKRAEYANLVEVTFARGRDGLDQQIWHQIEIDVPRTRPGVKLWMHSSTQRSLERILYVWAIRHPASGYVQGINDLVTPFFQVFLSAYIDSDPEQFDPSRLPSAALNAIEADSFWCLSRLLDGIQDNYIATQPGIQRSVRRMAELVARIDPPLAAHLASQNVEFMQFAFRWMNCLLMREISVQNTIRMWDTYLAEGTDAFSQFHLYVCSAFLVRWSDKLQEMDFQGIIMFLQSLPTQDWTDNDIELLLSRAFVLSSTWHNAQNHFSR